MGLENNCIFVAKCSSRTQSQVVNTLLVKEGVKEAKIIQINLVKTTA